MEILYEDQDIIVVHKESGLPVQAAGVSQKDLVSMLKNHLYQEAQERDIGNNSDNTVEYHGSVLQGGGGSAVGHAASAAGLSSAEKKARKSGEPYLGIVHRLDQPVEGILVFAKNNKAAGELSRQVQARSGSPAGKAQTRNGGLTGKSGGLTGMPGGLTGKSGGLTGKPGGQVKGISEITAVHTDMGKVYQAVVLLQDRAAFDKAKKAEHSVITLQDYLRRNFQKNMTEVVPEGTRDSRFAELTFRTLKIWEDRGKALLEIHLHTGRHHQIRVQLAHASLPLDGDRKYGPAGRFYDHNLRLCEASLKFRHPSTGKKMQFQVRPSFLDEEDLRET